VQRNISAPLRLCASAPLRENPDQPKPLCSPRLSTLCPSFQPFIGFIGTKISLRIAFRFIGDQPRWPRARPRLSSDKFAGYRPRRDCTKLLAPVLARNGSMAQRLLEFYDRATKVGGTIARSRLAALTMVPSIIAGTLPDSPELVASFLKALETIQRESQQSDSSNAQAETLALRAPGEAAQAATLRQSRCSKILSELLARRVELSSNAPLAYRTVTEARERSPRCRSGEHLDS
jgi:hypothetical protein